MPTWCLICHAVPLGFRCQARSSSLLLGSAPCGIQSRELQQAEQLKPINWGSADMLCFLSPNLPARETVWAAISFVKCILPETDSTLFRSSSSSFPIIKRQWACYQAAVLLNHKITSTHILECMFLTLEAPKPILTIWNTLISASEWVTSSPSNVSWKSKISFQTCIFGCLRGAFWMLVGGKDSKEISIDNG